MDINFRDGMTVPVVVYNQDQLTRLLGFVMSAGLKPVVLQKNPAPPPPPPRNLWGDDNSPEGHRTPLPPRRKSQAAPPLAVLADKIIEVVRQKHGPNISETDISLMLGKNRNRIWQMKSSDSKRVRLQTIKELAKVYQIEEKVLLDLIKPNQIMGD